MPLGRLVNPGLQHLDLFLQHPAFVGERPRHLGREGLEHPRKAQHVVDVFS